MAELDLRANGSADAGRRSRAAAGAPARVRARRATRSRFTGLTRAEAREALRAEHPAVTDQAGWQSVPVRPGHQLQFLGRFGARVVDADGQPTKQIIDSTVPLRGADDAGHLEPIDLSIEREGDHYKPNVSAVDTTLPGALDQPVVLGEGSNSVKIEPVDVSSVSGTPLGHSLVYANAQSDTDFVIKPVLSGVETFHVLRSTASSEVLELRISGPAGSSLSEQPASIVIMKDGAVVGRVTKPIAWDAEHRRVPVRTELRGDVLRMIVEHRGADVAYPVVVDPTADTCRDEASQLKACNWNDWEHGDGDYSGWTYFTPDAARFNGAFGLAPYLGNDLWLWNPTRGALYNHTEASYFVYNPPVATAINAAASIGVSQYAEAADPNTCPFAGLMLGGNWVGTGAVNWCSGEAVSDVSAVHCAASNCAQGAVADSLLFGAWTKRTDYGLHWSQTLGGVYVTLADHQVPFAESAINLFSANDPTTPFTITARDAGTGIKRVRVFSPENPSWTGAVSWNAVPPDHPSYNACTGGTRSPCPGAIELTSSYQNLQYGLSTIRAVVTDVAGNVGTKDWIVSFNGRMPQVPGVTYQQSRFGIAQDSDIREFAIFDDPDFEDLNPAMYRVTVPWNAADRDGEKERALRLIAGAHAKQKEVMVTFRMDYQNPHWLPDPGQYRDRVRRFLDFLHLHGHRDRVALWGPVNEPNAGQHWLDPDPDAGGPALAAAYYRQLLSLVGINKVVGPEFHDEVNGDDAAPRFLRWVRKYVEADGGFGTAAALHPYSTIKHKSENVVSQYMAIVHTQAPGTPLYLTEAGTFKFRGPWSNPIEPMRSDADQDASLSWMLNTLANKPYVRRLYYYSLSTPHSEWYKSTPWDTALLDSRPVFNGPAGPSNPPRNYDRRPAYKRYCEALNGAVQQCQVSRRRPRTAGGSSPVVETLPTITGEPRHDGRTLVGEPGVWSEEPTSFTYEWQRCDGSGEDCAAISGATGPDYDPVAADVDARLRLRVTAFNADGSSTATSAATDRVFPPIPTLRSPAMITGDLSVGGIVDVGTGTWDHATSYEYQWLRCATDGTSCNELIGDTKATYRVAGADAGATLRVRVTAKGPGGRRAALSEPTEVISRNTFSYVPCANPDTGKGVGPASGMAPGFAAQTGGTGVSYSQINRCGVGVTNAHMAVNASFNTNQSQSHVRFTYTTASGMTLLGGVLSRWSQFPAPLGTSFVKTPSATDLFQNTFGTCWHNFGCTSEGLGAYLNASSLIGLPSDAPNGFGYSLHCHTNGGLCNVSGGSGIMGGKLTLRDDSVPTLAESASGTLLSDSTVSGKQTVQLNARDQGSGLYRVRILLDGQEAAAKVVSQSATCADVNPANSDVYEFNSHTPCAASFDGTLTFDATSWTRGEHEMEVVLEDAGRNSVRLAKRTVMIGEAPAGDPPANTVLPAVGGQAKVGENLTVSNGTWSGSPTGYAYQWIRCASNGTNCANIAGDTSSSRRVDSNDIGSTFKVRVTARNGAGSSTVTSALTTAIARNTFTYVACGNPDTGKGVGPNTGMPPGFGSGQGGGGGVWQSVQGACTVGGATQILNWVKLTDYVPQTHSRVTYTTAAGLTMMGGEVYRSSSFGAPIGSSFVKTPAATDLFANTFSTCWHNFGCTAEGNASTPFAAGNRVPLPTDAPGGFGYSLHCHTNGALCDYYGAWAKIHGAKITLRDNSTPVLAENASGTLLDEPNLVGTQSLQLKASDQGAGLYRVRVLLDGSEVAAKVVNPAGSCADVNTANTDAYEFNSHTPCATSFDGSLSFDTTTWTRGEKQMEVFLEDAGRNAVRLTKRTVTVGEPDGSAAPANTVAPVVGGEAKVGESLTVSIGTWSGSPTSFAYQWVRCSSAGTNCAALGGETSTSHQVEGADVGSTLKVRVTARNGAGSTPVTSAMTTTVAQNTFTYVACGNPDTGKGVGLYPGLPPGFASPTGGSGVWQTIQSSCAVGETPQILNWTKLSTTEAQSHSRLTYTTAPNLTMAGGVVYRSSSFGAPLGTSFVKTPAATDLFANTFWTCWHNFGCTAEGNASTPFAAGNAVPLPTDAPSGFGYSLHCHTNGGLCDYYGGWAKIHGARITLRDNSSPTLTVPSSGSLLGSAPLEGAETLNLRAADLGSGLYRVRVMLDGQQVAAEVVDGNDGLCVDVNKANSDPYEFATHTPCRTSFDGSLSIETSRWPRGQHEMHVVLEDAGRNPVTLARKQVTLGS